MKERKWYKLDNVGKFYASIATTRIPSVFRFSAILNDEIDENILQDALNSTVDIYPNFNVNLKKGLFWYYLDETHKKFVVTKENLPICFRIYNNDDDFLYRVSYYKNKINLEVSHILSDGRGGIEFFKMLINYYVALKYSINNVEITTKNSSLEKSEDSFSKYYKKMPAEHNKNNKIYMYKGKKMRNQTRYMQCHLSTKKLLEMAHKYNATITSLLVSILINSFKNELSVRDMDKIIKIDIPVDLRTYFKSTSCKNFFGIATATYKFESKEDSLDKIITSVNKQFKKNINADKLIQRANLMVSFEKNVFCRFIPIYIKDFVLKVIDDYFYHKGSSCVSNIGVINFDTKVEEYIKSVSVLTSTNNFQFTICSFKDDFCIGISSKYKYNNVIKNFCRFFSENGLNVTIDVSEVD